MNNIINYFYLLDNLFYNNKGPEWLLNKNKYTFFLINNFKSENLIICNHSPYLFDYFFLIILSSIYISTLFEYNNDWMDINLDFWLIITYIINSFINDNISGFLFNFPIFDIDYFDWDNEEEIYILTSLKQIKKKYLFFNYINLKNKSIDLFNFKFLFYQGSILKLIYTIKLIAIYILILLLLYFYYLNNKNNYIIKNKKNNYKNIIIFFIFYKLKIWIWENYFLKK
jgi:hypothetical protein